MDEIEGDYYHPVPCVVNMVVHQGSERANMVAHQGSERVNMVGDHQGVVLIFFPQSYRWIQTSKE